MKTILVAILTVMAFSTPSLAKKTVEGTNDSMCLISTRNIIASMERGIIMSDRFNLMTIDQQLNGATHTITLESQRADRELGKKLYIVDVNIRAVGENKELVCEVSAMRSYLEQ